jgi:GAF domain-containing protein
MSVISSHNYARVSNINDLLDRTAGLIRERFGFYHVGVFLNDESNEYAVLRAAGGDAGRIMLANNHKLKIGEVGIVGSVAKSGEPRIALDVGADSVHFRNPLLPYTRSEMALPLKVGARLIGVLDVQSDKINAFDQNDVTIMSILTDQLAIAIERTRLLQESGQNAAALELALRAQTSRAWRDYIARSRQAHGYRYEGVQVEPLMEPDELILKGIASSKPVIVKKEAGRQGCVAAIPVQLRGQTLGVLNLQFTTDQISAETMRLLEEAANRLSLALENARLVEDAQRLASQEQQINIITGQIQQSTNLETILQNTIRELGKTLGVPKTFVQIGLVSPKKTNDK